MYIKVCKGDAISLNFKIIEYKIPEFEIIGGKRDNEVDEVISLIAECGYPFQVIGISEKEKDYMVRHFNECYDECYYEVNYGILRKCLNVSWKNTWFVTKGDGCDVLRIADYLEHAELMVNWAEKCIEFLKEKENN